MCPVCLHAFVGAGPLRVLVPMCPHRPIRTGMCPRGHVCPHVCECPLGHACPRGPQACLQCISRTCLQLLVSLLIYGWRDSLPCMEVKLRFFLEDISLNKANSIACSLFPSRAEGWWPQLCLGSDSSPFGLSSLLPCTGHFSRKCLLVLHSFAGLGLFLDLGGRGRS